MGVDGQVFVAPTDQLLGSWVERDPRPSALKRHLEGVVQGRDQQKTASEAAKHGQPRTLRAVDLEDPIQPFSERVARWSSARGGRIAPLLRSFLLLQRSTLGTPFHVGPGGLRPEGVPFSFGPLAV